MNKFEESNIQHGENTYIHLSIRQQILNVLITIKSYLVCEVLVVSTNLIVGNHVAIQVCMSNQHLTYLKLYMSITSQ